MPPTLALAVRRMSVGLGSLAVVLAAASPLRAQDEYQWSFSVAQGVSVGGSSLADTETSMRSASLDQPIEGLFSPTFYYPSSSRSFGGSRSYAVGYRVRPRLEIRLVIDGQERRMGDVDGYHGPFELFAPWESTVHFTVTQSMRTLGAAMVAFVPAPGLRVGVGFSADTLRVETRFASATTTTSTRPGLVLEAAIQLPATSRFYVELGVQQHVLAPLEFGPVELSTDDGTFRTTFPTTRAHFSHTVVSLGMGVRI